MIFLKLQSEIIKEGKRERFSFSSFDKFRTGPSINSGQAGNLTFFEALAKSVFFGRIEKVV